MTDIVKKTMFSKLMKIVKNYEDDLREVGDMYNAGKFYIIRTEIKNIEQELYRGLATLQAIMGED